MANVITQFLIGIGYDYDDKGERQAKAGMEAIKSSTLAIGSALSAAAIGASVRVDQLAEKSRKLQDQLYRTNTPTTWVQGYGVALTELGGNADDAVGRVTELENQLAAIKMGDRGFIDALGQAGFDAGDLAQAKDAQDFITRASDQFSRATHTQRLNMASVLHLTDSEFKLWEQGGSYVRDHSQQLAEQIGYTEELNQKQYEYSQSWVELNLELDKAGNTISNIMLPGMTGLVDKAREYIGALNGFAQKNPDVASSTLAGGAVAATGFGISSLGAVAGKFGIPGAGLLRGAGPIGAAAGTAIAVEPWLDKGLNALFGGSEYYQGLRTAPTWGDFGNALMGNYQLDANSQAYVNSRKTTPLPTNYGVPEYLHRPTQANMYSPAGMDYERQNEHLAQTLRDAPIRVDNNLIMNARVELDGRQIGEVIDTRIDEHNQQALPQFDTQVDR